MHDFKSIIPWGREPGAIYLSPPDHGTPPKVYGQMLKVSRRKRKVRKRNV